MDDATPSCIGVCRPNPQPLAACVLPTAHQVLLAVASSRHVMVSSAEQCAVLQLLSPSDPSDDAAVRAVAFCRASSDLAAGAGRTVTLFSAVDGPEGVPQRWEREAALAHDDRVECLAWAPPTAAQPRALWVAGRVLALWRAGAAAGWERAWSRELAQPVRHMGTSLHGTLATAGEHDCLVKVWKPKGADDFDFCYLRHPAAIASLEWRPPERAADRHRLAPDGADATDEAILLTADVDGVPRLWRMPMAGEPEPRRMFLCATLTTESSGQVDDDELPDVRLVQWLQPTSRPSFPPAGPIAADAELGESGVSPLSPVRRPPLSPLLSPGMGVPTLRPSLRERHDYVLALRADGTLVVWLVLGLSAEPRCSPKLMVWASLPQVLPPVEHVLSAASFCNFDAGRAGAGDQLPSAISIVQHTAERPLRLLSVNVERGAAAAERVRQQLIGGHGAHPIEALHPHPACSLVASLDASGELLLWESAAFSHRRPPRAGPIRPTDDAAGAVGPLQEPPTTLEPAGSAPTCLLRLPGRFDAAAWLPCAPERAALVALDADEAHLFVRTRGCWSRASTPLEPAGNGPPRARWMCAHAFKAATSSDDAAGFALRAQSARALVWLKVGATIRTLGEVSLERDAAAPSVTRCAAPLLPASGARAGSRELGRLLCGYSDGAVCIWTLASAGASLVASMTPAMAAPPAAGFEPCCLDVSEGASLRAAVIFRHAAAGAASSANTLQVLEFESSAPGAQVEFECALEAHAGAPHCALIALVGGAHLVAVGSGNEVVLYAQSSGRQAAEGQIGAGADDDSGTPPAQWAVIRRWSMPEQLACTAAAWAHSGALAVGAGAFMLAWPLLLCSQDEALSPCASPQWHPTTLLQQLLAAPERCQRVLQHLASQTDLENAESLPLPAYLHGEDCAAVPQSPTKQAEEAKAADLDDLFAPKAASSAADMSWLDGPTEPTPLAGFTITDEAPPAQAQRGAAAGQLLQLLQPAGKPAEHLPGLEAQEETMLVRLLKAQKVADDAGAAMDACGARFILYALTQPPRAPEAASVPGAAVAWAILSDCHATLLEVCCTARGGSKEWAALRGLGVGFWLPQGDALRGALEAAAKAQFTKRKDPQECALLYIALGKKNQLLALCKAVHDDKMQKFLANDFSTDRWRSAALKNAYSLLSKQQCDLAIAFFLLADEVLAAVKVCARQLGDLQLALVLCRLHSASKPEALRDTVREHLLPEAIASGDAWLCCVAQLLLGEPTQALEALAANPGSGAASEGRLLAACGLQHGSFEPCTAAFCAHLAAAPRWRLAAQPLAPKLLLRCAYALGRRGCLLLAMEALRGGVFDKRAPAFDRDDVPAHLAHGLFCRFLSERAVELVNSVLDRASASGTPLATAAEEAVRTLRADAEAVAADASIPLDDVRAHAERGAGAFVSPLDVLPRLVMLGCLRLWQPCRAAVECAAHGITSTLASCLPHELPMASCSLVARAAPALLAGVAALLAEGALSAHDPLRLYVLQLVQRAEYALCCSLRDFKQVLGVLRQRPLGVEGQFDSCTGSAVASRLPPAQRALSPEERYVWTRLHLCALQYLRRAEAALPPQGGGLPPLQLAQDAGAPPERAEDTLLVRWMLLLRISSRDAVGRLSDNRFPLEPISTLSSNRAQQAALSAAWALLSELPAEETPAVATPGGAAARAAPEGEAALVAEPLGIWPLAHERTQVEPEPDAEAAASAEPKLGKATELLSRKGDFVRAVCVNALNSSQLAVSLGRGGVQQLELSDTSVGGDGTGISVQQMQQNTSKDFSARCLCAHPKLPLYLAGGDSVVQCWQFGQTIQGQGLHDHLRAQYKLTTGCGRVANIRISPECEQFSSIDASGFLCLWRFQSGADMPLPFSRLQCHTKRGADLCFVNSSVVLATVGLSHASDPGGSLCLWDVLLPPAQAMVAACTPHADGGRCVLHCAADQSLVSGGERGEMAIFDLRQRRLREKWSAHSLAVQALALADSVVFSTSADADIKLWSVDEPCAHSVDDEDGWGEGLPRGHWKHAHESHMLAPLAGTKLGRSGVTALTPFFGRGARGSAAGLISGGADGKLKLWRFE